MDFLKSSCGPVFAWRWRQCIKGAGNPKDPVQPKIFIARFFSGDTNTEP